MRGRKLSTVEGSTVRPTADRVKEAMFSILAHRPKGAIVLDLFAGSGGLGIEAISRGARFAVFIDNNPKVIKTLYRNIDNCKIEDKVRVILWDIKKNLNCLKPLAHPFDLVLMDPPYGKGLVAEAIEHLVKGNYLAENAIIAAEHEPGMEIDLSKSNLVLSDARRYGSTQLSFITL